MENAGRPTLCPPTRPSERDSHARALAERMRCHHTDDEERLAGVGALQMLHSTRDGCQWWCFNFWVPVLGGLRSVGSNPSLSDSIEIKILVWALKGVLPLPLGVCRGGICDEGLGTKATGGPFERSVRWKGLCWCLERLLLLCTCCLDPSAADCLCMIPRCR